VFGFFETVMPDTHRYVLDPLFLDAIQVIYLTHTTTTTTPSYMVFATGQQILLEPPKVASPSGFEQKARSLAGLRIHNSESANSCPLRPFRPGWIQVRVTGIESLRYKMIGSAQQSLEPKAVLAATGSPGFCQGQASLCLRLYLAATKMTRRLGLPAETWQLKVLPVRT
jgi:hypothetical protein